MTALRRTCYPRRSVPSSSAIVGAVVERIHSRGYTYASVAARAGVSESTISRICRGQHSPSVELVERLADAIGLRVRVENSI